MGPRLLRWSRSPDILYPVCARQRIQAAEGANHAGGESRTGRGIYSVCPTLGALPTAGRCLAQAVLGHNYDDARHFMP